MKKPPIIAVINPSAGVAPEAMVIAILKGRATSATVNPASTSPRNKVQLYSCIVVMIFGWRMETLSDE